MSGPAKTTANPDVLRLLRAVEDVADEVAIVAAHAGISSDQAMMLLLLAWLKPLTHPRVVVSGRGEIRKL